MPNISIFIVVIIFLKYHANQQIYTVNYKNIFGHFSMLEGSLIKTKHLNKKRSEVLVKQQNSLPAGVPPQTLLDSLRCFSRLLVRWGGEPAPYPLPRRLRAWLRTLHSKKTMHTFRVICGQITVSRSDQPTAEPPSSVLSYYLGRLLFTQKQYEKHRLYIKHDNSASVERLGPRT